MTVQEVISLSKNGELNNLSVKNKSEAILGYLNLGVLELYKRFPLKVEEYVIELVDGVTIYDMPEDFMWIVSAYQEVDELDQVNWVDPIPINKEDDPLSLNTVGWRQVQIPTVTTGGFISVIYVAKPTWFTEADMAEDVEIPPQMLDMLLDYMAYRGHSMTNGGVQEKDSVHYQRFEAGYRKILGMGMFNMDDMNMDSRVEDKGFV